MLADSVGQIGAVGILGPGILKADDIDEQVATVAAGAGSSGRVIGVAGGAYWLANTLAVLVESLGTLEAGDSVGVQAPAAEVGGDNLCAGQRGDGQQDQRFHI